MGILGCNQVVRPIVLFVADHFTFQSIVGKTSLDLVILGCILAAELGVKNTNTEIVSFLPTITVSAGGALSLLLAPFLLDTYKGFKSLSVCLQAIGIS